MKKTYISIRCYLKLVIHNTFFVMFNPSTRKLYNYLFNSQDNTTSWLLEQTNK